MKNQHHQMQMVFARGADLDTVTELYGAYRRRGEGDKQLRQRGLTSYINRSGEPCDGKGRPVIDSACEEIRP